MARYFILIFICFRISQFVCAQGTAESENYAPLRIKLPFPAGSTYEVIQGNHGTFTHTGFNAYAWDFAMPVGNAVCAVADGRVVRVKQDSDEGGPEREFLSRGNTIVIDHGNGYFSQYLHLKKNSVFPEEGTRVRGGQLIALSGNTGFSTMPHLHFQVQDALGRSLPAKFLDIPGNGIPQENTWVTSGNNGQGVSAYAGESPVPTDVFRVNGVHLAGEGLPGVLWLKDKTYAFHGRIEKKDINQVAFFFLGPNGGVPLLTLFSEVDANGAFRFNLDWNQLKKDQISHSLSAEPNPGLSFSIAPVNPDGSFWSDISLPVTIR